MEMNAPVPVRLTVLASAFDKVPIAQDDMPWDEAADEIEALADDTHDAKTSLRAFHFGSLSAPYNVNENVDAHTALVIDVDRLDLDATLDAIDAAGIACLVYESPSSAPDARRVRVCAPVTRPIAPGDVKRARHAFAEAIGIAPGAGVEGADAVSQIFFCGRLTDTPDREVWRFEGAPVDVDALLARPLAHAWRSSAGAARGVSAPARTPMPAPAPDVTTDAIALALASHWSDDAPRDRGIWRAIGGYLARRGLSDAQIAAVACDVRIMCSRPDGDTRPRMLHAVEAARQARVDPAVTAGWVTLESWHADAARALEAAAKDPREPHAWPGVWSDWWARYFARRGRRVAPADALPMPEADADAPVFVVLTDGRDMWHMLPEGGYTRFAFRTCMTSLRQTGAIDYVCTVGPDGRQLGAQAMLDAGPSAKVDTAVTDFRVETEARYDADGGRILLGVRAPTIAPCYDADVDAWLRELAGPASDAVHAFIASCAREWIGRWAIALGVLGPDSIGKTLLAKALASMWGAAHPVPLRAVVAQFNATMTRCPIVLDDECDALKAKLVSTETLRQLIQDDARDVEPKGLEKRTLLGCQRFIFTGNDPTDIQFTDMRAGAMAAMGQRMAIVHVPREHRERVIAALRRVDLTPGRTNMARMRGHFAWIQDAWRTRIGDERFIGSDPDNAKRAVSSMMRGEIERQPEIFAIIEAALATGGVPGSAAWVHAPTGELVIRPDKFAVGAAWDDTRALVRSALGAVWRERRVVRVDGTPVTCHALDTDTLRVALDAPAPADAQGEGGRVGGARKRGRLSGRG